MTAGLTRDELLEDMHRLRAERDEALAECDELADIIRGLYETIDAERAVRYLRAERDMALAEVEHHRSQRDAALATIQRVRDVVDEGWGWKAILRALDGGES